MERSFGRRVLAGVVGAVVVVGCGTSMVEEQASDGATMQEKDMVTLDPVTLPGAPGDADLPPTGASADILAWIATGQYSRGRWQCEPGPHASRSPSPHGMNRICSNATLSGHGAGEFPIDAAGVKELFDASGTRVIGHSVYRKVAAGGGAAWYWFEVINGRVGANGLGDEGAPKTVCVRCHSGAGSDAQHSGHDLVYTQVRAP